MEENHSPTPTPKHPDEIAIDSPGDDMFTNIPSPDPTDNVPNTFLENVAYPNSLWPPWIKDAVQELDHICNAKSGKHP